MNYWQLFKRISRHHNYVWWVLVTVQLGSVILIYNVEKKLHNSLNNEDITNNIQNVIIPRIYNARKSFKDKEHINTERKERISNNLENTTIECKKKQMNVAFLKVHKAGSTTIQNMFLRFAKTNGLNVILPRPLNYLGFDETINMQNIYPPPENENYNILCHHVIYNKAVFYKFMPRDTVFTAIVRNPITQILSAAQFFHFYDDLREILGNLKEQQLMSTFLQNPDICTTEQKKFISARMSLDFGIPKRNVTSPNEVLDHLKVLDSDFILVMVMEMFDESLILLKRNLRWSLKDVIYVPLNARNSKNSVVIEGKDLENLKKYNQADFIVYDFFKTKFVKRINEQSEDFHEEVKHFKRTISQIKHYCSENYRHKHIIIESSIWNEEFSISREECNFMYRHEFIVLYYLVMEHKRKLQ